MRNRTLILLLLIDIILTGILFAYLRAEALVEEAPDPCPSGSYHIGDKSGEPLCKLEPTGCPYGDSIPMDTCDKFAPAPVPEPVTVQPTYTGGGK